MDPEFHKLVLLYAATGLGIVVTLAGLILFFLGAVAGSSGIELSFGKVKAKLTRAGPGAVVTLFGVALIVIALWFAPSKRVEESTTQVLDSEALEAWLANTKQLSGKERYSEVLDKLVGTVQGQPVRKLRTEYIKLDRPRTLGELGKDIYGDTRFWPLVAAINMNKLPKSSPSRFRSECLNAHWFLSLDDAKRKIEAWRQYYNEVRPHSALKWATPAEYARRMREAAESHVSTEPEISRTDRRTKTGSGSGAGNFQRGVVGSTTRAPVAHRGMSPI